MTTGGPPWEGAPTAPLPDGPYVPPTHYHAPGRNWPSSAPDATTASPRYRRPARRHPWLRRILITILALTLVVALLFTTLLLLTPSVSNAPTLARAIDRSHHVVFPGPPVPTRFADALTSTEDHRFYSEPGIDPLAIARVIKSRITGGPDQGGATLYQQLAKMLYTPGQSGLGVRAEQVMLGIKLSFAYSKARILRMYAGVAYYGHGYYGLAAASCGYFGEQPAQLTWPQAAMLAGLVQAPTAYDPILHFASGRARQFHVLSRLVATGALTQAQATRAYRQPLHLVGGPASACF